ncbi:DUF2273 domain-containing protein [Okibacterium fritillariae]|uniref:Small integral membrane protein n=1 Tax=Okibacterium fritillariae TaxID=123320 RepID=A0A1T5IHD6_9MICO|nr:MULTISPECIES: DUF2273 domain-containing protein [Microbacteriaceae]ONI60612.1 hypothetical protein ALI44B_08420 [Leifsonia sp. ALI-44-B]SKC38584.1 Small integral membrane protein [Okibacterium fritillariae]
MSNTTVGIFVGAILAVVALWFGFWGFLLAVVLMAIGALVGRILEGKLDLGAVADALRGKRSSS